MQRIIRNVIKCKTCGKICESKYTHDFVACDCPEESETWCAADGGTSYLRRVGDPNNYEDFSEVEYTTDEEDAIETIHRLIDDSGIYGNPTLTHTAIKHLYLAIEALKERSERK